MKKAMLITLLFVILFATSAAKACSEGGILNLSTTETMLAVDPYAPRAVMTIIAKDSHGEILCDIGSVTATTSRNIGAPTNGWAEGVDAPSVYIEGGLVIITVTTSERAGTTLYVRVNHIPLGDGIPFSFASKAE